MSTQYVNIVKDYEPNDKQILQSCVFRCKNKREDARIGQYLLPHTVTSGLVFENRPIATEPHASSEKRRAIVGLLRFLFRAITHHSSTLTLSHSPFGKSGIHKQRPLYLQFSCTRTRNLFLGLNRVPARRASDPLFPLKARSFVT